MAFFDKLKGAFDRGGIGLKLELPKQFSWGDATISATVILTGHKDESRQVDYLSFNFVNVVEQSEQKNESDRERDGNLIQLYYTHSDPIELAPGQTVTIKVNVPAFVDIAGGIDALGEAGVPKLMQGAMKFIQKVTLKPDDVKHYEVTVWAHVDGVKNPKRAHRRILNQKSQGFKMRTMIAGIDIN